MGINSGFKGLNYIGKPLRLQVLLRYAPENHLDFWASPFLRSTVGWTGDNPERCAPFPACAGERQTDTHGYTYVWPKQRADDCTAENFTCKKAQDTRTDPWRTHYQFDAFYIFYINSALQKFYKFCIVTTAGSHMGSHTSNTTALYFTYFKSLLRWLDDGTL